MVAPQIAPGEHRLPRRFFSFVAKSKCNSKGVLGQATVRLLSAEKHRARGRARIALRDLTRRGCLNVANAVSAVS